MNIGKHPSFFPCLLLRSPSTALPYNTCYSLLSFHFPVLFLLFASEISALDLSFAFARSSRAHTHTRFGKPDSSHSGSRRRVPTATDAAPSD